MREPGRMADRRGQQGREAAKRIRWTRADAEGVLAQWSESGGSLYAHARRHDLPEQRLYYWRARLAEDQDERLLLEAFRRIPLQYQVLLEPYLREELSAAEVAEILDVPESTVRSRLRHANDRLRTELLTLAGDKQPLPDTVDDFQAWAKRIRETIDR